MLHVAFLKADAVTRAGFSSVQTAVILLSMLGLALWADLTLPESGVWALLLLGISVGFVHGALDVVLLPRHSASNTQAACLFLAYLLAVLLLGWLLSGAVSVALGVLLVMSVWHFGEPFGRWNGLTPFQSILTRAAVGGAPVMLPVWLAPAHFAAALGAVVPEPGMRGWHALAWVWLVILVLWMLLCGVKRMQTLRYAWFELLGCAALFAVFSPLMAFALYFGAYHAPVHICRVWRAHLKLAPKLLIGMTVASITLTTFFAWLLGAGLEWLLMRGTAAADHNWGYALRWFIVAFAALTAPHLVLISLSASYLSSQKNKTIIQ